MILYATTAVSFLVEPPRQRVSVAAGVVTTAPEVFVAGFDASASDALVADVV